MQNILLLLEVAQWIGLLALFALAASAFQKYFTDPVHKSGIPQEEDEDEWGKDLNYSR